MDGFEVEISGSSSVIQGLTRQQSAVDMKRSREKGKDQRATVQQVLDPRTRRILEKLQNNDHITHFGQVISTGKEANVYLSANSSGAHLALKIYKTSILVFKDREKYIRGERRFQTFCKSNPRKLVSVWAEKEMRNLKRVFRAGLPCPEPILLKGHVLLMQLIGSESGDAAPRLKDAVSSLDIYQQSECYVQVVVLMWRLLHQCRLVHADMSEYNTLYHDGTVYVIDVSQSVEHDHPNALEFLRMDVANVTLFFRKLGVCVLGMKELFSLLLAQNESESQFREEVIELMDSMATRSPQELYEEQLEESTFLAAYIPKSLDELYDDDIEGRKNLASTDAVFSAFALRGLVGQESDSDETGSDSVLESEESEESTHEELAVPLEIEAREDLDKTLTEEERKRLRKLATKEAKEANREKRKNKMKKKEKKKHLKSSVKR